LNTLLAMLGIIRQSLDCEVMWLLLSNLIVRIPDAF
jgi:hypothetical protein